MSILEATPKPTITKWFLETVKKFPDKPAYQYRDKDKNWQKLTWKETYDNVVKLASALADMKIKPQDKIGFMADNRYEWIQFDQAILMNNAVSVPRGTDSTADEMKYILEHSDSIAVIVENKKTYDKIQTIVKGLKKIKTIIAIDKEGIKDKDVISFDDLLKKGESLKDKYYNELKKRVEETDPDDTYTIIYTSGTTGLPKGVQQTHRNEEHQMRILPSHLGLTPATDTFLSILPVWHTFERMAEYIVMAAAGLTAYTNIRELKNDIKEVKPTFMASAPRLWEQIYLGIMNNVKSGSGVKRALFNIAVTLSGFHGKAVRFLGGNELRIKRTCYIKALFRILIYIPLLPLNFPFYKLLDAIVLKKIRAATGGRMRGTISGGGALPRHVDLFFNDIGINVLEGYGMTESAPVISARKPNKIVVGSVGPLLEEVQVEIRDMEGNPLGIGEKGVIWTKGPHVMKGYYKMPDKTAETVVDGWLNTGDMGFMSYNDTLSISGRAKETIVLLGGENVEPVPIENKLLESEYISQIMVVGQDKKTLGALIFPDLEKLAKFMNVDGSSITIEQIQGDDAVKDLMKNEIKGLVSASTGFKSFEKVVDFRIIPKPFELNDELTAKLSMKRHVITEKYQHLIDDMYK